MKTVSLALWVLFCGVALSGANVYATDIAAEKAQVVGATKQLLNQLVTEFNSQAGGNIHLLAAKKARWGQTYDDKKQAEADYENEKQRCFQGPVQDRVACLDQARDTLSETIKGLEEEEARLPEEIKRLEGSIQWAAKNAAEKRGTDIARLAFDNGLAFEGATSLYIFYHDTSMGRSQTLAVGTEGYGLGHSMYHEFFDPREIRIETANFVQVGREFNLSITGTNRNNVQMAVSGKYAPLMDGGACSSVASVYRILNPDGKFEGIPQISITRLQRTFFEWALGAENMAKNPGYFLETIERCAHFVAHDVRVYRNN